MSIRYATNPTINGKSFRGFIYQHSKLDLRALPTSINYSILVPFRKIDCEKLSAVVDQLNRKMFSVILLVCCDSD